MARVKVREYINSHMSEGDKWYCYQAPEPFHFWTKKNLWINLSIEKLGVNPLSVKVSSEKSSADATVQTFTKKNPLVLPDGLRVYGTRSMKQSQTASLKFRVDSTKEINETLKYLSAFTNIDQWLIRAIEVYNKKSQIITFERFNPDGSGVSLYFCRYKENGKDHFYPSVSLDKQRNILGDFKDHLAHCTINTVPTAFCAIKKGIKSNQVKLRKTE